ncbi:MAG: hypothetical protein HFI29_12045 [Lachnospiraceae bacterium]|jgi:acetyltransferase-like isoleucine patch superfamily enzyme|nr:hypothetical protein [Lachnospiraceae bacterium]
MSIKSKLHKLRLISFYKTVWMNVHYFGIEGVFTPHFIISKNVIIRDIRGTVTIDKDSKAWLGFGDVGFIDQKYERMIWDVTGNVVFKGNASFCPGCKVVCMSNGRIEFGKEFSCNARTKIVCNKNITFGDNCMISWDCTFLDTDFHKIVDSEGQQRNIDESIQIGDHVWICSEVLVLKGSKIPSESVISVRSVVSKELREEYCIYHNNNICRENSYWEK